MTLKRETPLYLLGGYGGVTRYLLSHLFRKDFDRLNNVDFGIDDSSFLDNDKSGVAQEELDSILELWELKKLFDDTSLQNWSGLNKQDYLRLAFSQRPAEIMSLVLQGFEQVDTERRNG